MTKQNKYSYVKVLQGNYDYGWDDLTEHDSYAPAKKDLACYRQNEKGVSHRIRMGLKGKHNLNFVVSV